MTWDDLAWLRILNAVLSMAALTTLGMSFARNRYRTPRRIRRLACAFYGILLVTAYGSGRLMSVDAPLTEHVLFLTASLCGLLGALAWHPHGDYDLPPNDGSAYERAKHAFLYYRQNRALRRNSR